MSKKLVKLNPEREFAKVLRVGHKDDREPSARELLDCAILAAHTSGKVLMRHFRSSRLKINDKPGAGWVTNADVESEQVAARILKRAFPNFGILAEESGLQEARCPGRWILDPLDGTSNYAHGLTTFCVSIAVEWKGILVAGVIYHPTARETYTAIRGRGAFVNGRRIRVSLVRNLSEAFLSTGFSSAMAGLGRRSLSSNKNKVFRSEIDLFQKMSRLVHGIRRPGSAALDLASVARGCFDGFWEQGLSAWDVAAGQLLIEEAGGQVTDFSGNTNCLESKQVIASNGSLHNDLLEQLNEIDRTKRSSKRSRTNLPRNVDKRELRE